MMTVTRAPSHSRRRLVLGMGRLLESPGETYLRDDRKIDIGEIADVLVTNRRHRLASVRSVSRRGPSPQRQEARRIIAVMTDVITAAPTGAISRTYIHEGHKVGKAKTLGSPAGSSGCRKTPTCSKACISPRGWRQPST